MAEKCFHSLCASIIPFYLNPWLITLGSKIANVQLSTGILYNVIKNSSSLKIMAIISEVKGCMDPSPAAGSAVREGKEKKECPDHGQETHNLWHSFRKALVRLGFAPASPAFSRNEAFGVTVFLILWSQSFAAAGKLGIKLQATITFSCRDIFWISFSCLSMQTGLSQEFELICMWSFVHPHTKRKAHSGVDFHTVSSIARLSPSTTIAVVTPPHSISMPALECSWQAMYPAKHRGAASLASGSIWRHLAMVSNVQMQLHFLASYHCAVLSQPWPPLFHWLETGWLSERGV